MSFATSSSFSIILTRSCKMKCLSCLMVFLIFTVDSRGNFEKSDVQNQAQFVENLHRVLDIKRLKLSSLKVHDSMACILQCLRSVQCYSVNFAIDGDDQGHLCELFKADMYRFSDQFKESNSYHHYSIAVRQNKLISKTITYTFTYRVCKHPKLHGYFSDSFP